MNRRTSALTTTLLAALSMLACIAPAARAADNGAWSVFPTPNGSGTSRLFFLPFLRSGHEYRDSVTVTNKTDQRLRFNLYAADATLTPQGTFSLRRRTDPKTGVAAWVQLPYQVIDLGPHSQLVGPFTIDPPRGSPSGDLLGGIVAEQTTGSYKQSGEVGVSVLQAVGVRIYARVDGPLRPALRVEHLHVATTRSAEGLAGGPVDVTVSFDVRNAGNVLLTPTERASVQPWFGSTRRSPADTLPQLPPGSVLRVVHHYRALEPFLHLEARVSVTAPGATARATSDTLVVPWVLVAIVLGLLVAGGLMWWRRRRRSPPTAPGDTGAPPGERTADLVAARD